MSKQISKIINQPVGSTFASTVALCMEINTFVSKAGKPITTLTVQDASGQAVLKYFEPMTNLIKVGDLVRFEGKVAEFKNAKELHLDSIMELEQYLFEELNDKSMAEEKYTTYNIYDYLYTQAPESNVLEEELSKLVNQIQDSSIKELVNIILYEYTDTKLAFRRHSAAKGVHHSYIRGLMEHSISVAKIALSIAEQNRDINKDLVIAGALLHDIGKTLELSDPYTNVYTDKGYLYGHHVLGQNIIQDVVKRLDYITTGTVDNLCHIILSHHGKLEYGSPVVPRTIEALVVSQADNADAQTNKYNLMLDKVNGLWGEYEPILGVSLRKTIV